MRKKYIVRAISLFLILACICGCTALQSPPPPTASTTISTFPIQATEPTEPEKLPIAVSTFAELMALASGDSLQPDDIVQITAPMEITEEIFFHIPICLSVAASVTCTQPITFQTFDTGTLVIDIGKDVDISGLNIRLDAPNCDVLWETAIPFPTEEAAALLTNVRTFNGIDLHEKYGLGGAGTNTLLSVSLEPEDNPSLTSPLVWLLDGNTANLSISYLIDDSILKNAQVRILTSDGNTVTQPLDLTSNPCIPVTDTDGNTRTYRIQTQRITYNLPVFYIEIEDGAEVTSRDNYRNATLRIDTENAAGNFPALETSEILIRGRGHYSWKFDKKPYKIRFEKKTSVLGMNASKNWTLIANYTDRSLIQNHVAMEMGKVMDHIPYHSNQYPVDVFVNGSYRGVYTFGEQLEAKEERIDLEENYDDPNTDYLLEVGGYDEGDEYGREYFHASTLKYISIKHPETAQLQQAQLDYLIDYVQKADKAVQTLTDYESYIDVDSLIDWVIIHELTYNLDCCFRRSCYLIKEKDGKLKMGPIWDFDLAFGSFYRYQEGDWATIGEQGGYVGITWMNYLHNDPAFMARFTARWNEVKQELLAAALTSIDTASALVAPSAQMNFEVWDILGQSVSSQPASHKQYDTYEKMVKRLRSFIEDRYQWLDEQLN